MNCKLAVIGCGSSGQATAAYFALGGMEVTLCCAPGQQQELAMLEQADGILLRGNSGRVGLAKPLITADLRQALAEPGMVIISAPAHLHAELAKQCAPLLVEGHTVLVSPGNLGSLLLRNSGVTERADVAEISDNLWACRSTGQAEVMVALPLRPKRVSSYPASGTDRVIKTFSGVLELVAGSNIIETALNSPNVVTHVPGSVLNAVQIEKQGSQFAFFQHGLSRSVVDCITAVEQERNAVLRLLGLAVYGSATEMSEKLLTSPNSAGLELFRQLDGPDSLAHRYIEEDAICGMALMVSIANEYGVNVPVSQAALTLAGCFNHTDYLREGRTLANLGLNGKSVSQLLKAL